MIKDEKASEDSIKQFNDIFKQILFEAKAKPEKDDDNAFRGGCCGFKKPQKKWFGKAELEALDKWDIIAALIITVGVIAATIGIVTACSYFVAAISGAQIIASSLTALMSDKVQFALKNPVESAKKMQAFIENYLPWVVTINPLTSAKELHHNTKDFLIKHFASVEDFETYLQNESNEPK